jgi:F-type H+-transporting ATPase subunit b
VNEEPGFLGEPRNWVLIAFILFFVIFGKKLWAPLAKMLDDRGVRVRAELDEAARLRAEAEAMLREAEARRAEALREAQALIEGAKAEAERVAAAAAAEAEASARRREQMAMDRIAAAEKAAVDEVRLTAAEVATVAARQVIAEGLSADADARLIDHAIAQLPTALAGRRVA